MTANLPTSRNPETSVPSTPPHADSNRLGWIDSARGLAAILVMLHHYIWVTFAGDHAFLSRTLGSFSSDLLEHYLDLGVLGVALFFFISGYIVPVSAMPRSARPLSRFFIGRFFRLYPAYWVSLALAAIVLAPKGLHLLINFTMFQRFLGAPDILGLYWTLQVELIFYFLIALLLACGLLKKPAVSVFGAVVFLSLSGGLAAVRFYSGAKSPLAPALGLSLMFAGNFWYWFSHRHAFTKRQAGLFYSAFLLCLYVISWFGYHRDWGNGEQPARFITTYSIALVLFLTISLVVKRGVRLIVYLGSISYSLYLFHELVMFTLWERLPVGGWSRIAVCSAISIAVAAIGFRLVERPAIAFGKRIVSRNGWTVGALAAMPEKVSVG